MRNENFDIPVTIETEAAGRERVVTDTIQAAEILLRRWPDDGRGQKYKAALRACMDAMEQRRAVASARKAFVAAAKDAHIFVRSGSRAN
jgi:integrase